jgi:hypothetical protein
MAAITVIKPGISEDNMGAGAACSAGGDYFVNDGVTLLRFTNTDGSPVTVTVDCPNACSYGGTTVHDETLTVAATTGDIIAGPWATAKYNDSSGYVQLTYSAVTALKVWALSAGGTT